MTPTYIPSTPSVNPTTTQPTFSYRPTVTPVVSPTYTPTYSPSFIPTLTPQFKPTRIPNFMPTVTPTIQPAIDFPTIELSTWEPTEEATTTADNPVVPSLSPNLASNSVTSNAAPDFSGLSLAVFGGIAGGTIILLILLLLLYYYYRRSLRVNHRNKVIFYNESFTDSPGNPRVSFTDLAANPRNSL